MGSMIDSSHIVRNGSFHFHVAEKLQIQLASNSVITLEPIHSSLVQLGKMSAFPTPLELPKLEGAHFNLVNNIWGTNYIMWYPFLKKDENLRFDFKMEIN